MKTVEEFNKEFVEGILKLQEKRKDFLSKKIEKYCLEKNLKITDIVAKANNKTTIKTGKITAQKTNIKYNDGIPKIL